RERRTARSRPAARFRRKCSRGNGMGARRRRRRERARALQGSGADPSEEPRPMRALYDSLLFAAHDREAAGFRLFAKTRTLYSVRLWGPLHALWADRFTHGLAGRGLSILNGFARQDASGGWVAEFLITPVAGAAD